MRKLILLPLILLSGCGGITTNQLVSLRSTQRELSSINSEIQDNLQASFWGLRHNKNTLVREDFEDIISQIIGEPSPEEKRFAENANIADTQDLKKETESFLKRKSKLENKLQSIGEEMVTAKDRNNLMTKILFGIFALVLSGFVVFSIWSKLPIF